MTLIKKNSILTYIMCKYLITWILIQFFFIIYMHMILFLSLVDLYRTAQYMTSMKLCDLFWKTARGKYIQCKCWRIDSGVKWGPRLICFTWRHNTFGRYLLDITQSKIGINKGECLYIYIKGVKTGGGGSGARAKPLHFLAKLYIHYNDHLFSPVKMFS